MVSEWCTCGKAGICIGCLIAKVVREQLGLEGFDYLSEFVPTLVLDKPAAQLARHLAMSTKVAKTVMNMNL